MDEKKQFIHIEFEGDVLREMTVNISLENLDQAVDELLLFQVKETLKRSQDTSDFGSLERSILGISEGILEAGKAMRKLNKEMNRKAEEDLVTKNIFVKEEHFGEEE